MKIKILRFQDEIMEGLQKVIEYDLRLKNEDAKLLIEDAFKLIPDDEEPTIVTVLQTVYALWKDEHTDLSYI